MFALIDILTFLLSLLMAIRSVKLLTHSTRYLINLLIFVLYVLPLALDYIFGYPDYGYKGYMISSQHWPSRLLFDMGILTIQYVLSCTSIGIKRMVVRSFETDASMNWILWIGMVLPVFFVLLFMRNPAYLYSFQWREFEVLNIGGSYSQIERYTYLGITCSVLVAMTRGEKWYVRLIAFLFLFMNICIQGKRAIFFFAAVNFALVMVVRYISLKREKQDVRLYTIGSMAIVIMMVVYMVISTFTIKAERGFDETNSSAMITTTRIDFFRDDRVRLAIYSNLHPEHVKIVDYPGQTFFAEALTVIPLNYYTERNVALYHHGYQSHLSAACWMTKWDKNVYFMTPSVYDELIANFGLIIGTLLMILLCLFFARTADKYPAPYSILILCCFVLLCLFSISYIIVLLILISFSFMKS